MASSKKISKEESVYLDELTLPAAWKLLQREGFKNVIVLEAIKSSQKLGRWLLNRKGFHVAEASFFAGHLKTEEGESVYMAARTLSGQIALQAAMEIIKSESHLKSFNETYGRNTIYSFIFKVLHLQIRTWTVKAMVVQTLCETEHTELWLKEPLLFNRRLLIDAFPSIDLHFYPIFGLWPIKLIKMWILDMVRDTKLILGLGSRTRNSILYNRDKPSILMLQEDNIRADLSLRGQPHWLDLSNSQEMFNIYLVEHLASIFSTTCDTTSLSKAGLTILPTSAFQYSLHAVRNNKTLHRVRRDKRIAIMAVYNARGFANKFFLLRAASLLRQAELMGALALWLNTRVFLIRETYYSYADAMQLVAPDLNVTTIAYQYSNLGVVSPTMISTADKFLVFSDMYKAVFQTKGIAPREFLPIGYLYDGAATFVLEKAKKHRKALMRTGAKFIICYFDESVQHDRWGMVSKSDHLDELHALAEAVLSDFTFGVVIKSQFMRNSPSQLYPDDELILAAKATGRYFELMEGKHRNDIYPTEAALVADLCISHKFGATAALEAAIAGVRTVMLDSYGTKTLWDSIYSRVDIEYETMELLMSAIAAYRAGSKEKQSLGDWTPILSYFDPYLDGKSTDRLRTVLKNAI